MIARTVSFIALACVLAAPLRAFSSELPLAETSSVATSTAAAVAAESPPQIEDAPVLLPEAAATSTVFIEVVEAGVETATVPEGNYSVLVVGGRIDRPRIAGSAHYIDKEQLERFEQDDIHRVLSPVPGVYVREEEGYGLRPNIGLRGASSERSAKVTLMEDGVLLAPAPYSAPAAYYFPITTRMTGVEVFKGPASIRHGPNTIGGAINLLTRSVRKQEGAIDVSAGLERFGKLHGYYGDRWDNFRFLLEGAHLQTTGFKDLDGGGDTGFAKNELMLKARVNTDAQDGLHQWLEAKLGYADETSNETYLGLSELDFEKTPYRRYAASQRDRMEWDRSQIELRYFLSWSAFELTAILYRHDLSRDWRKLNRFKGAGLEEILAAPDTGQGAIYYAVLTGDEDSANDDQTLLVGTNARDFVSEGAALLSRLRLSNSIVEQQIELGARLHFDAIDREHTEDGFLMRTKTLVSDGQPTDVVVRNRGSALALAIHLLDEVQIGDLLLTPGVRFEHIETSFIDRETNRAAEGIDDVIIPGIGAHYAITEAVSVLLGVHRGFSPVSPGQPDEVEPEQSVNYEAGGRIEHEHSRLELIGFFNDYSNLTGECTFATGCPEDLINAQFNGGAVWVYGLEASAGQAIEGPFKSTIRADLAYTFTTSEFKTSFDSENPQFDRVDVGDELAYVPQHQAALMLDLERGPFSLSAKVAYVSEMRNVAGQGEIPLIDRIPPHVVLDASASYTLGAGQIYLRGDNLTNSSYVVSRRPFGARPGHPLLLMIGYKHRFGD